MKTSNSKTSIVLTSSISNTYLNNDGLLNRSKVELLQTKVMAALENHSAPMKQNSKLVAINKIYARNRKQIVDLLVEVGLVEKPREIKADMTVKNKDGSFKITLPKAMLFGEHTAKSLALLLGSKFPHTPNAVFTVGKAKYNDFDAKQNRAGDAYAYLTRRCVPVKEQKKATPKSNVLLLSFPKGTLPEKLQQHVVAAVKAIHVHTKAIEKIKDRLKTAKAIVAEQRAEDFDLAAMELEELLVGAGISSKDVVVSQGMMGKNIQVKLPGSGLVVAVSLSKLENLAKARAGAAEPTEKKAPKKTKKPVKKVTGKTANKKAKKVTSTKVTGKKVTAKKKPVVGKKKVVAKKKSK